MNEWEFTADAASWINEALARDPDLPFSRAKCEQRGSGSRKRRDLSLLDKETRVVLTGEIKLPFHKDGSTPFNAAVVKDARSKARGAGARFFFTWNVNEFILWETSPAQTAWQDQNYASWDVARVYKESHLEAPDVMSKVGSFVVRFLNDFAGIIRDVSQIGTKAPDEKFVEALESALRMPILLTFDALTEKYKDRRFKSELDHWMRDDRGWTIVDDPEGVRENLDSASKFACYALVNKIVFYEALLKRLGRKMATLFVPDHVDTGETLRGLLEGFFAEAQTITGDYETVFGVDHLSIGNRIPFYSDNAVARWREVLNQVHRFDFTKLDYEVIGNIFERLIEPERRKKYGQFYTRVEVVDLINSFCITTGYEKVMDPACGGGTFLVRAYARKKELTPESKHRELLADLYGVDREEFAAHLSTINLATRDLVNEENYPRIVRSDFFDVKANVPFLSLPTHGKAKGESEIRQRPITVPTLDAIVGNPPYIRQESIPSGKNKGKADISSGREARKEGTEPSGTKEHYAQVAKDEANAELSGRSDIHCYFWPHAMKFLRKDGYLCFLTSSQWLDVEYGFDLQRWMLCNFEIVAILESVGEPWFEGARVTTAITILRRQPDEKKRMSNLVRFIQIKQPIADVLSHDGTIAGAVRAADRFRDEILGLKGHTSNERFRVRLIPQRDLWKQGVELGRIMGKSAHMGEDEREAQNGDYYGGKWGVYLRAPDLWFELLLEYGSRLVPLGDIAHIRRGITSGKDSFFFPIDCSSQCLEEFPARKDFQEAYRAPRKDVESGKIRLVRCGEGRGEIRPIEAEYLEPEVHSLMEIDGFTVSPEDCSRRVLLVGKKRNQLKNTYVLEYIKWGEKRGYHAGATCAARAAGGREWYDLTGHDRGALFWSKSQQYKHAVPLNDGNLQCNCNLYDVYLPKDLDASVLAGILNSSLVVLSKFQYGRPVGVEGNLKTEIVDVNMMLVPDPRAADRKQRDRVAKAFGETRKRRAMQFLSERRMRQMAWRQAGKEDDLRNLSDRCELDMPDRWELDDVVLELLGVRLKKRRKELLGQLYSYLREFFELTRGKEEWAIENKKRAKRRGPARANDIATEIVQEIGDKEGRFLRRYHDFIDAAKPFDTYEVPSEGAPELHEDMLDSHGVVFRTKGKSSGVFVQTRFRAQDDLLILVSKTGVRGWIRIPCDEEECRRVYGIFKDFVDEREERISEMIEERTIDDEMRARIRSALMPLICR